MFDFWNLEGTTKNDADRGGKRGGQSLESAMVVDNCLDYFIRLFFLTN